VAKTLTDEQQQQLSKAAAAISNARAEYAKADMAWRSAPAHIGKAGRARLTDKLRNAEAALTDARVRLTALESLFAQPD
jgi:hypothetical protein